MKKIICFITVFVFLFFPLVAFAEEGWQIDNYRSDIAIQDSGIVTVKETIAVDFQNLEKHGIYRTIPYVYQQKDGSKYYTEVLFDSILQDSNKAKYSVSDTGFNYQVKIGDADRTISGKHTYVISYLLKGILRGFGDHDELYWNVTGNDWGVPIIDTSVAVTLPKEGLLSVYCYKGLEGSKDTCSSEKKQNQATFSTSGELGPNENMSVAVLYKKGMVPLLSVPRPKSFAEKLFTPLPITIFCLIGLGSFIYLFSMWRKKGRDEGNISSTLVVEYTSPEKLRPAEVGVLMDEKADTLDVTATIIDLTGRRYMTITEIAKKWVFGKTDYKLERLNKKTSDLLPYEFLLLDKLFEDGNTVIVSTLKNKFYQDLAEVKKALYKDVVDKKLFVSNPDSIRTKYIIFGVILIIFSVIVVSVSAASELAIPTAVGGGFVVFGIWLVIFSGAMPKKTAYGHELYQRIKGYRLFISEAEKYRQRFFEKKHLFNEVMPYAIVFGLTKKFADAMKEIGLKNPEVVGYYGAHPFNSTVFASSVNDFSSSMSSAISKAPSSSGSSGSSGGGFGGGGGGSW
ncbi:MAG: DUF2207 domain-containing protein [Candidatus Levybacteria bacterium]|nr:DUF2207 domain-containing protein [Candidatus Levybacteria bacterium]